MSRKRKHTRGNPAQVQLGTSHLDRLFLDWAQQAALSTDDPDLVRIALALMEWVGAGDPGKHGINQCYFACTRIGLILDAMSIRNRIVPVKLTVTDARSGARTGAGSDSPQWQNGIAGWTGHAVLYLPDLRRMIDPTVGQALPKDANVEITPLVGRVSQQLTHGADDGVGAIWLIGRGHYRLEYTVLHDKYHPAHNHEALVHMRDANQPLIEHMSEVLANINEVLTARGLQ